MTVSALQPHFATGVPVPWSEGASAFLGALERVVRFDELVLGVIDPRDPKPDALLLSTAGVEAATLVAWCERGHRQDALLREAKRKGVAVGQTESDAPGPPLPAEAHAMTLVLPVSLASGRVWYVALGRSPEPFDESEQRRASLVLRQLNAGFDYVPEPGLGRLLMGADGRLIHADAITEQWLEDEASALSELAQSLPAVVAQRWPDLADRTVHDVALELSGGPRWIRLQRVRAASGLGGFHWYLELRPLGEDDIPAVGVLEDDRVAKAVALLSDQYATAPTLGQVADAVHTSPFHFHRLFVRHVGRSPKHYLLRMQLMIAKQMLRGTRTSIGEIAQATGFASHGHFTATFHRMVGVSPSQYREGELPDDTQ